MDRAVVETTPTSCWYSISVLNIVVFISNIIDMKLRSLVSAHCSPNPTYAVFTKQHTNMPLAMKVEHFGPFFGN